MAKMHAIVGVWRVMFMGAPTPYHMFAFHNDGTMQQSNPAAGNTETSDTAGMGVWEVRGGGIKARFEEFRLDLKTEEFTRGALDFTITVRGNTLSGACEFTIYNAKDDSQVSGPHTATLRGKRVLLPDA